MNITLSNPRLNASIDNWPLGGSRRGVATFAIEGKKNKGYRVGRTTTGKTKYSTYGGQMAIVDGSDGRTYILQRVNSFTAIRIIQSDCAMDASNVASSGKSYVYPEDADYQLLSDLIIMANPSPVPSDKPWAGEREALGL